MTHSDRQRDCDQVAPLLVDLVEDRLDARQAERVRAHCAQCADCRAMAAALREIPAALRAEDDLAPEAWLRRRDAIVAAFEAMVTADRASRSGFDARLLLPVAAAVLIGLAGVISLRSDPLGSGHTRPARAAFVLALNEPQLVAELAEILGETDPWPAQAWQLDAAGDGVAGAWLTTHLDEPDWEIGAIDSE